MLEGITPHVANDATAVVQTHADALLARAIRLTHGHADAWDLVQDTLLKGLTRRPSDLSEAKLRHWLMVILFNLYRDRCRAEKRRRLLNLGEQAAYSVPCEEVTQDPAWRGLGLADVRACLDRLDPRYRDAYVLYEEEGLPLAAIAARQGVPLATAGTRIHRARRNLRKLLCPA